MWPALIPHPVAAAAAAAVAHPPPASAAAELAQLRREAELCCVSGQQQQQQQQCKRKQEQWQQRRCAVGTAAALLALASRPRSSRAEGGLRISGPQGAKPAPAKGELSKEAQRITDEDKKQISSLAQRAEQLASVPGGAEAEEEEGWNALIKQYGWVPEIEVRAVMNRGNSRARRGKFTDAVSDYGRAIELAPGEPDPYLNRGASYEALGRFEDALADYSSVLSINPRDPAAWNNRGNALLALSRFTDARDSFRAALQTTPAQSYAFPALQLAIAELELGNDTTALKSVRDLVVRYADGFPEARAIYALILWDKGDRTDAEAEWDRATAEDARYRSLAWVTAQRRWPTKLRGILDKFAATTKVKVK